MQFTKDKFMTFYKGTVREGAASACFDKITEWLNDKGILSDMTLIGALATVRVEGRPEPIYQFKPVEEMASGSAYENRHDLGNYRPGDGPLYKGRGLIQITGYNNYKNYGAAVGIDLVCHPERALDLDISARILAQYFKDHNIQKYCDLRDWQQVRKLVNGGLNGYDTFLSVVNQYLALISPVNH